MPQVNSRRAAWSGRWSSLPAVQAARQLGVLAHRAAGIVRERRFESLHRQTLGAGRAPDDISVVLVFSGTLNQLYQAREWLWPLSQLDVRLRAEGLGRVAVLCRDGASAAALAPESSLPVFFARTANELDGFLSKPGLLVAFYPNQATLNFQSLAFPRPAHVHLSHGESDKISMVSNQLKAYDAVFTAGQAARRRITNHLVGFRADVMQDVGRPQHDQPTRVPASLPPSTRVTTLYAPTWEGNSGAMSYSSLAIAGVELVTELIESGRRVIYRPHPQTGSRDRSFAEADRMVTRLLSSAGDEHFVDRGAAYGWQWSVASEAVVDVSAVAFDALQAEAALVMVRPGDSSAVLSSHGLIHELTSVDPRRPQLSVALTEASMPESRHRQRELAEFYFGDTQPGAQLARFVDASVSLLKARHVALELRGSSFEKHEEAQG